MELAVCQICKDPVWSYICSDCLSRQIVEWLPRNLSEEFRKFNRFFLDNFTSVESNRTTLTCVSCAKEKEVTICPFCHIAEIFHWLQDRDPRLARKLFMMLPVDSDWKIDENSGCVWHDGIKPIAYEEREADEGTCEECGGYSEETEHLDGRWVCGACSEYG